MSLPVDLLTNPYLWLLTALVIGVAFFKSPVGKGIVGEVYVNLLLRFSLDKTKYYLCNNVTLPTNTGTTQIDHLIVSRYGIFMVETKNMKGWIYGGERQKTWTQKIFKHSRSFQNPLRQNFKHTKTLTELLGIHHRKIIPLIVFVGESTFKTAMPTNVVQGRQCLQFIKAHNTPVFNSAELVEIMLKIEQFRLPRNLKTHRKHIAYLKRAKNEARVERKRRSFKRRPAIMLVVLAIFSCVAVLTFFNRTSDTDDQLASISAIEVNTVHSDSAQTGEDTKNNNTPTELVFSDEQVRQAAAELLTKQNEVNADNTTGNDTETATIEYVFEIELLSGGLITTDNATLEDDTVTFTDKKGFVVSINKDEIRTMKKVKATQ